MPKKSVELNRNWDGLSDQEWLDLLTASRKIPSGEALELVRKFAEELASEIGSAARVNIRSVEGFATILEEPNSDRLARIRPPSLVRIEVDSAEQIQAAINLADPSSESEFLLKQARKQYFVRRFRNYFVKPHPAGARYLAIVIEVPLKHFGASVFEISISHRGMDEVHAEIEAASRGKRHAIIQGAKAENRDTLTYAEGRHFKDLVDLARESCDRIAEELGLQRPKVELDLPLTGQNAISYFRKSTSASEKVSIFEEVKAAVKAALDRFDVSDAEKSAVITDIYNERASLTMHNRDVEKSTEENCINLETERTSKPIWKISKSQYLGPWDFLEKNYGRNGLTWPDIINSDRDLYFALKNNIRRNNGKMPEGFAILDRVAVTDQKLAEVSDEERRKASALSSALQRRRIRGRGAALRHTEPR
ncbi:hypothetical protein [Methylobacterium sp. E-046]|uniref:hypothetical protein n=1 Tax=Methylobacterium sp. E-046 TaxID=2836576 RepID=UPI001FB8AAA5|nr:hypothetical protein [Methylobacterium sp. E-046]MCJ2097466.1 hypothetical protein [Methylobacterium sp. E-046]